MYISPMETLKFNNFHIGKLTRVILKMFHPKWETCGMVCKRFYNSTLLLFFLFVCFHLQYSVVWYLNLNLKISFITGIRIIVTCSHETRTKFREINFWFAKLKNAYNSSFKIYCIIHHICSIISYENRYFSYNVLCFLLICLFWLYLFKCSGDLRVMWE